jgi:5-methylcytosine-specific restriction endonuclease McrA
MQHVSVIDKNKMFLMPCHPARARELLRKKKTRYRQPRVQNRTRPQGWMAPSLLSRVDNVFTWAKRLINFAPVSGIVVETVRFDTQHMQNPEISSVEYQQGELAGYEAREYLLEKWGRTCAYCGSGNVPLEVEHIVPRVKGGANRTSNLTLSCKPCNQAKGLQVSFWSGGRTKYNRTNQSYGKSHWLDAVCVGATGGRVHIPPGLQPLHVSATGRGSRRMCRVDTYGFPRTSAKSRRGVNGCKTGDPVKAAVNKGKKAGTYVGGVSVRKSGSFNSKTEAGTIQGISWKHCSLLQRADGYNYYMGDSVSSST